MGLWRSREIKTDDSRLPSATTAGKRLDDIVDVGWVQEELLDEDKVEDSLDVDKIDDDCRDLDTGSVDVEPIDEGPTNPSIQKEIYNFSKFFLLLLSNPREDLRVRTRSSRVCAEQRIRR